MLLDFFFGNTQFVGDFWFFLKKFSCFVKGRNFQNTAYPYVHPPTYIGSPGAHAEDFGAQNAKGSNQEQNSHNESTVRY